jgi:hypothetical protein
LGNVEWKSAANVVFISQCEQVAAQYQVSINKIAIKIKSHFSWLELLRTFASKTVKNMKIPVLSILFGFIIQCRLTISTLHQHTFVNSTLIHASISVGSTKLIAAMSNAGPGVAEETFPFFGNTAAASIHLAMHHRHQRGELRDGDQIAWPGLAAGVSVPVQLMVF